MKVAIVGSGIAGLSAAHALRGQAELTLLEAGDYFGGHTNTIEVSLPQPNGDVLSHGVDTGFLVFNERTYPGLIALLAELGVPTAASDMSFSVQVPRASVWGHLEWNGADLDSVFAQRRNLLNPRFLNMLREVVRFNQLATGMAERNADAELAQPLSAFLADQRFGMAFRDWYLLPMLGCIWSCPTDQMLQFPVATLIRFCHNHGLIQVNHRPRWFTVDGGARQYVAHITAGIADKRLRTPVRRIQRDAQGVQVFTDSGPQRFDQVILAAHADQSLAMLAQPSPAEAQALAAIRFQANVAVLHTDTSVMPRARKAWAAWNYQRGSHTTRDTTRVCLHYWLNRLQPLPFAQDVVVSLNPLQPVAPHTELGRYDYMHPVFDLAAIRAQRDLQALQGQQRTWFAGAWMGYGFHEDGLKSGYAAAQGLLGAAA